MSNFRNTGKSLSLDGELRGCTSLVYSWKNPQIFLSDRIDPFDIGCGVVRNAELLKFSFDIEVICGAQGFFKRRLGIRSM